MRISDLVHYGIPAVTLALSLVAGGAMLLGVRPVAPAEHRLPPGWAGRIVRPTDLPMRDSPLAIELRVSARAAR